MAAATSLDVGSVGNLRFLLGLEGSYAGGDSSTGASCMCTFLALGLLGPLFGLPLGRPFAFGLIGSGSGSGSGSSGISSGISCIISGISNGIS